MIEIKPSSDEYLLGPGAASCSLAADIEDEMSEDKNPPPLMLPSPSDTASTSSTSSFLNLLYHRLYRLRSLYNLWLYEMYGFQLQGSDAANVKELW